MTTSHSFTLIHSTLSIGSNPPCPTFKLKMSVFLFSHFVVGHFGSLLYLISPVHPMSNRVNKCKANTIWDLKLLKSLFELSGFLYFRLRFLKKCTISCLFSILFYNFVLIKGLIRLCHFPEKTKSLKFVLLLKMCI